MEAGGWFPTRPPRILFRFGIDRRVSGEEKSLKGIAQIVLLILLKNLHSPSLYNVHGLTLLCCLLVNCTFNKSFPIFTTKITVIDTTSDLSSHLWSAQRGCQGSGCCRESRARSPGCCTAGNHPGTEPAHFIVTPQPEPRLMLMNVCFSWL